MIRKLPAPIHRAALRLGDRARKAWWRWRRPQLIGCRVIAVDDAGRVLLIRHSYGARGWTLPAGGLRGGEDPVRGALRELREETACLLEMARLVETLRNMPSARRTASTSLPDTLPAPCAPTDAK